jgi:hypothetical protein
LSKKFDSVPVEADTKVLFRHETNLGKFEVLYEKWEWDGITADSIIFIDEDVADLDDKELENMVSESPFFKGGKTTIKRSESGFTFVNFNFESD